MKKCLMNLRKTIMTVLLFCSVFLLNTTIKAQIVIDGNPSEWGTVAVTGLPYYVYVSDSYGSGMLDNGFTQGSKDFMLASDLTWTWGQTKGKNDIANVATVIIEDTLYFAGDRLKVQGDAQIGFWLLLNGTAPEEILPGQNSANFSPEHAIGDILMLANFTGGGSNATISVFVWVGVGNGTVGSNLSLMPVSYPAVVAANNTSTYPVPAGWDYPFLNFPINGFYEGKIYIGDITNQQLCNTSFLLETRSSPSITAALDDFVSGSYGFIPDPPVLTGGSLCGPGQICLTATAPAGLTIKWYDALPPMVPVHIGPTYCVNLSSSQQFWATASDGVCESDPSAGVWAYIYPVPTLSCVPANPDCWDGTGSITAMASGGTAPYLYTITPGGISNATGIFTGLTAGNYTVIVTDANMCADTCYSSITVPPYDPVVLNCPSNLSYSACDYLNQAQIDILFYNWLNSFSYSGGTNPVFTMIPSQPLPPYYCGGTVTVTWTVTDICEPYISTCTSTFEVIAPPAVVITTVNNLTTNACDYTNQTEADAAFTTWLNGFGVSGGCNPQFTINSPNSPITLNEVLNSSQISVNDFKSINLSVFAPDFCGGSVSVTWTVTDQCYQTTTHSATFEITAPPPITYNFPSSMTADDCETQSDIDVAFANWLISGHSNWRL
jgi:hypothetical protein